MAPSVTITSGCSISAGTESCEARFRREVRGGIQVPGSISSWLRHANLRVDDLAIGNHGKNRTTNAAHAVRTGLTSRAEVGAHVINPENVPGQAPLLAEPTA